MKDDAGFRAQQRLIVQHEIQQPRLIIDRSVFKKTFSEQMALRKAKAAYRRSLR